MKNPENPIINSVLSVFQASSDGFQRAWQYQDENQLFPSIFNFAKDLFVLGLLPLFALPVVALKAIASRFGLTTTEPDRNV